jgi:drug/metabolite transporter, DME family
MIQQNHHLGSSRRRAYREMAIAGVLWGTIGPAAALIHDHTSLSPLQTSFWRLVIAIVPLALLALVATRGALEWRFSWVLSGLGVGAIIGVSQLSYFAAVADSGIAIPTLVSNGLGPVLTAVGQTLLFGERPDRRTLVAMATALVGLALLVIDAPGEVTTTGVLLSVVAATSFAMYSLAAGPASRRMDVRVLNASAIAGGALVMLPVVLATGGPGLADSTVGWLALLHLGLIVSGLAYGLYFSAARALPSTHLTILMVLEPLVATLIAAAGFGETLTAGTIVGGALMLGAVIALRPAEPAPEPAVAPA